MLYQISGKIQHYPWGGSHYLPALLNVKNENQAPFAEYWLGAHPKAASTIRLNPETEVTLDQLIAENPAAYLGEDVAARFGRLPYLFKVLDVHDMLSIQVHPSKEEAEKGFANENAAGIPLQAPDRNYKDDNHKPEMMVALSTFYLLHGFLQEDALRGRLETIPEFAALLPVFAEQGYPGLYSKVMHLPQAEVNQMLLPLFRRISPLYHEDRLQKEHPDFWAARALASGMTKEEKIDRGIFSIYFFNLLRLQPGEGIFQAAGVPHAYLEGQNIELMANSDNVLRGGLTSKHVDVKELLKHVVFEGIEPHILKRQPGNKQVIFPCPVPDFSLEQLRLKAGETFSFTSRSVEIILLTEGEAVFKDGKSLPLAQGEAALATAGEKVTVQAKQDTELFKAGVPVD